VKRDALYEALVRGGTLPRSSVLRLGALLPSGSAASAYVEEQASSGASKYLLEPSVMVQAPSRPSVTVAAPTTTAQSYASPSSVTSLMSPATPYPIRLEPFPLGSANLVCSEHAVDCTPENVAKYLFRAGDYAYAQAALRYLLTRKPTATDLVNVMAWSRAIADAATVALNALNLWHTPSGLGDVEVIARYYSMNPSLAVGFNPDLYRGYVEVPELASFWQRHFRGTAFLSAGSEYRVPYTPNPRWTPYATGEARVTEALSYLIPELRRPVTTQMLAEKSAVEWDRTAYDVYVRALWLHQGGIASSQPGWFAIAQIPKRSDSDIAFSRSTFWIAQPASQLEFSTIWANFIIGTSFQELFKRCFEQGWRTRYVAPDAISLADASAVSRGIKDLTSGGAIAGYFATGLASGGSAFVASGPAGAVAAWAVSLVVSAIDWSRRMSASHALTVELARHPVIQPLFRRWFSAAECNASGAPSLDTATLMTKYGATFATLLERLTAAGATPATPTRSALVSDLLTSKKRSYVPLVVGGALAAVLGLALLKGKR